MDNIVKYKNGELFQLSHELVEFLDQKLPILVKYKLTEFSEKAAKVAERYVKTRNELITELQDQPGLVSPTIPDPEDPTKTVANPKYAELLEKIKPVDEDEKEFKFRKLSSSFIEKVETSSNFPLVYRLFDFGTEEVKSE
jgi:hypothetical protein